MRKCLLFTLMLTAISLVSLGGLKAHGDGDANSQAANSQAAQSDQERVSKNRQTLLTRLKRDAVGYRGDKPGEIRVKWEWVDQVLSNYVYHKYAIIREVSAGEKYELRPRWVFKDVKLTFQDIFALGPEDDDKLFPISFRNALPSLASNATFEGLTLLGKQGEVKGPFKTRVVVNAFVLSYYIGTLLQYVDKEGKEKVAFGIASDAFTLRWKDIKNRIADDMSEEKALEDLRLERDKISADLVKLN